MCIYTHKIYIPKVSFGDLIFLYGMAILFHFGQNKALRNCNNNFKLLYIISRNGHDIKDIQVLPFSFYVVFTSFVQLGPLRAESNWESPQKLLTNKRQHALSSKVKTKRFFTSRSKLPRFCMKSLQSFLCKVIACNLCWLSVVILYKQIVNLCINFKYLSKYSSWCKNLCVCSCPSKLSSYIFSESCGMYAFFSKMFVKISRLSIAADSWKPLA